MPVQHNGRTLIGYAEIAAMLNVTEQWLRKIATQRKRDSADLPLPVEGPPSTVNAAFAPVWFDKAEIIRWAKVTGRLDADGRPTRATP